MKMLLLTKKKVYFIPEIYNQIKIKNKKLVPIKYEGKKEK
jgi:hypothetical protein